MTPVGPIGPRRLPERTRRQMEVAAAAAWEAIVEVHTGHALRFIALLGDRLGFDRVVDRYLDELDIREPVASAVRSRVLVALEHALEPSEERPSLRLEEEPAEGEAGVDEAGGRGLERFRPDRIMEGLARKVRASEELEQWVGLAVARAEEGVVLAHVDNAVVFAGILEPHRSLSDAVEDYLEIMRVSGGRAQSVHQRAMARLAEARLGEEQESPREG